MPPLSLITNLSYHLVILNTEYCLIIQNIKIAYRPTQSIESKHKKACMPNTPLLHEKCTGMDVREET